MKREYIKTIDVKAKEWFDKVNGNSYFSGLITINFGMGNEETISMPFQYGYGNYYEQEAKYLLTELNYISNAENTPLSLFCRDNGIIYRSYKQTNCKKKELNAF